MAAAAQSSSADAEIVAEIERVWSLADKDQGGTIDAKELFGECCLLHKPAFSRYELRPVFVFRAHEIFERRKSPTGIGCAGCHGRCG